MGRLRQYAVISDDVGSILRFISVASCLPLGVTILYREWALFLPMAAVPAIYFLLGTLLVWLPLGGREARLSHALFAVALIWLIGALVGALPFYLGSNMPYLDSFFEAMSGWTDTGLTMIPSVDEMPRTLLFWRSYMQWLGGLGIVAFTIAMLRRSGLTPSRLYRSEGRTEAFLPSVVSTGVQMWKIYITLTLLSVGLILISGVTLWDAVNLAMCAIAGGGFSVHSTGILYYESPLLEVLLVPVMIAGALPFKLYYLAFLHRETHFFSDEQARLLFVFIAIGIVVFASDLVRFMLLEPETALRQGLFMTTSAITSTGFQITSPREWPGATVLFFILLMLIGGSSGSTAGGIKLSRAALSYPGLVWWFRRFFVSSRLLVPFRYEGRTIPRKIAELEISKNMLIIMLYLLIVFITTLVMMHCDPGTMDTGIVIFEVVSAIGNNGITSGLVGPDLSAATKTALIVTMWAGRLEVMPVIVLFKGLILGFER
jgi:trk system potassium uptake protein TrkH